MYDDEYESAIQESVREEIRELLSKINLHALADHASSIRKIPCSAVPIDENNLLTAMGNINYHIELEFNDGVRWIARIKRQNVTAPSKLAQKYIIQSEVATYRFLEMTEVPAPRVFAFHPTPENSVGVAYILMEKIPGKPYPESRPKPTDEQRLGVIKQLAFIYHELHKHPFNSIGSLNLWLDHDNDKVIETLGPFENLQEYHLGVISKILEMIAASKLYSPWAVDTYLIHCALLEAAFSFPESSENQEYYLRHYDDLGSHILVDENFKVTGIIDWEWAYTAPASVAFTSPMMLWDVGEFFNGHNGLSSSELAFAEMLKQTVDPDSQGLDEYVICGKAIQRLQFILCNGLPDWDISLYIQNFAALQKALKIDETFEWESWKKAALQKYANDERLQRLVKQEAAVSQ
ncbi:hypothetical protein NHQ30_000857 [Ciborinia camelliae]|nr:hypothetical protein NHQ30_000857 [Ciborinia camelliae]